MPDEPQESMADEEGAAAPAAKSKLSFKTLILIGLPLVIVQALVALVVVQKIVQPRLPEVKPPPKEETQQADNPDAEVDLSEQVPIKVEDIIVNPAETKGQRYLSVSVVYYVPKDVEKNIGAFEFEVRSAIIERIGRKRLDELDDPADRQILLGEIREELNSTLRRFFSKSDKFKDLQIQRILFSKYTLQ